jgi:hypothetical protein
MLVNEISVYCEARSEKHQKMLYERCHKYVIFLVFESNMYT